MLVTAGRATHLFEHGPDALLTDWLAWPLLGADAETILTQGRAMVGDLTVPFSTWLAVRSRLCEDWTADMDAKQLVVLGAGLDSTAWRCSGDLEVFEVDHPASQAWKRARVAALGLPAALEPVWVPVDFEHERLSDGLRAAGFDERRPTFVSWLGVTPFLSRAAISATLGELPRCRLGVVYLPPVDDWADALRANLSWMPEEMAKLDEPWLSMLTPHDMRELLSESGFRVLEDVGSADVERRYGLPAISYERIALAEK